MAELQDSCALSRHDSGNTLSVKALQFVTCNTLLNQQISEDDLLSSVVTETTRDFRS